MAGRLSIRWVLLAAACAVATTPRLAAQDLIRMPARSADNSLPIKMIADDFVEYRDSDITYYRLLKAVLIDQGGLTRVRGKQAVVKVKAERFKDEVIYFVDVYAEGDVALENGAFQQKGQKGVAELSAKTAPIVQSTNPVVNQSLAADPLFHRAREAWTPKPIARPGAADVNPAPGDSVPPLQLPGSGPPATGPLQTLPGAPSVPLDQQPGFAGPAPPPAPPRVLRIAPRTGGRFEMESIASQNAVLVTGGIILSVSNVERFGILDIEADSAVIWTKGDSQQFLQNLQTGQGETNRESEFYLSGNVVLRMGTGKEERVMRADQIYYDVGRNVAIATAASLELRDKNFPEPLFFKADEVFQLGPSEFRAAHAEIFSSRLPSDPGLKLYVREARLTQRRIPRRNIFGKQFINLQTGEAEEETERYFQGDEVRVKVADVPVFRTPFIQGTLSSPTGPIHGVTFRHDKIFGYQFGVDLDMFNLLGLDPAPLNHWTASVDEFTKRGPGLGSIYEYAGDELFGFRGKYSGLARIYGLYDQGVDVLGGPRTGEPHPKFRGRFFWEHLQDLSDGWQLVTQVSLLSDKNFLEQYYKPEFDEGPNQETFAYLSKRSGFWAASLLVEPRVRDWVTETAWLPKGEGRIIGWSPFDLFSYTARASAGLADLKPTSVPPPPVSSTDVATTTGRFDLWQELALPFNLGPVKVVPFGAVDLTAYTSDLNGNGRGRFYGAGGASASVPLSSYFPNVQSDLFNVQGIYHKIVLGATYYIAHSSVPFNELPQLDRLNDDATDQALRDITPLQPVLNPAHGVALATSPIFDPQRYAIRRLIDDRVDTLDSIQVVQLDLRQRWQTKRGFPGLQHTVDLFTLDLSCSLFPNANRDNFGSTAGFIEYDAVWNVGDRTSLVSTGWVDPFADGARYFTLGMNLGRPDSTLFSVGFRYVDPIDSRLITAAANYVFSQKYSMTASASYDFGPNKGLWNSLTFTRSGTDLQLSVGISYNPILNNFGFSVNLIPLLVANRPQSTSLAGMPSLGRLH